MRIGKFELRLLPLWRAGAGAGAGEKSWGWGWEEEEEEGEEKEEKEGEAMLYKTRTQPLGRVGNKTA